MLSPWFCPKKCISITKTYIAIPGCDRTFPEPYPSSCNRNIDNRAYIHIHRYMHACMHPCLHTNEDRKSYINTLPRAQWFFESLVTSISAPVVATSFCMDKPTDSPPPFSPNSAEATSLDLKGAATGLALELSPAHGVPHLGHLSGSSTWAGVSIFVSSPGEVGEGAGDGLWRLRLIACCGVVGTFATSVLSTFSAWGGASAFAPFSNLSGLSLWIETAFSLEVVIALPSETTGFPSETSPSLETRGSPATGADSLGQVVGFGFDPALPPPDRRSFSICFCWATSPWRRCCKAARWAWAASWAGEGERERERDIYIYNK